MRKVIKVFFISIGIVFIGLVVIISFQSIDPQQNISAHQPSHAFPDTLIHHDWSLDSIVQQIGAKKTLPPGYELQAAIALSAYAELSNVSIEFVLTDGGAPMESNFRFWTLFGTKNNRVYQIRLNDAEESMFDPILLRNLPFDAQVGILAHELGHVVYYDQLTLLQIAKWGLMYLISRDFQAIHERTTDLMPVHHGLDSQIYQYAYYVRHDPSCRPMYEAWGSFMDRFYMTDKELKDHMQSLSQL